MFLIYIYIYIYIYIHTHIYIYIYIYIYMRARERERERENFLNILSSWHSNNTAFHDTLAHPPPYYPSLPVGSIGH